MNNSAERWFRRDLTLGELPPTVGPTDVLVAVESVAVDPVDALVRSGVYRTTVPLPFVLSRDLTGRVVSMGSDVVGFEPGERVWANSMGHDGRQGAFAEYAAVPGDRCYRVPDGVDATAIVAVAHPAATAWLGLSCRADVRMGETVVVGGAAGNVGAAVVELAAGAGGGATAVAELEAEGTQDIGWAIRLARRHLDAGAYMIMVESEGITENVRSWRTDAVATIANELGLEKVMFEAADPKVFGWYIKNYGPEVNVFVDHSQVVQLETLRSGIWGEASLFGRVLTYKDDGGNDG